LVELVTGLHLVIVYQWVTGWCQSYCFIVLLFHCFIVTSLIAIFLSDFLYQTIPNEIVYPAIALSLVYLVINHWSSIIAGSLAGLFFWSLFLITKGQGMGSGDVKLAILMGLFLGYPKIIVALYLAFLTGALVGVILVLLGKKRFGEHIPFGPFLVGGALLALFFTSQILKFSGF